MQTYRKRPLEVKAIQWFPESSAKCVHWEMKMDDAGEYLVPYVITMHEQRAYLVPGDWIIAEPVPDRYYPCKPDIFEKTYERVEGY